MDKALPTSKRGFLEYFSALVRFSPFRFFLACALNLTSAVLSGVGLLMLIPLLHYTGWLPSNSQQGLIGQVLKHLPTFQGKLPLLATMAMFLMLVAAVAGLEYWRLSVTARLRLSFLFELRQRLNGAIARAKWSHILERKLQHAHHMITVGLSQIATLTQYCLQMVSDLILLGVYLAFSLVLSFRLTLLTGAMALIFLFFFSRRKAFLNGKLFFAANRKLQDKLAQFLDGVKLAKSYDLADSYVARFDSILEEEQGYQFKFLQSQNAARLSLGLISAFVFCAAFFISVQFLHLHIAVLIAFLILFSRLMPRVSSLVQTGMRVINLAPVFGEMTAMLEEYASQRESLEFRKSLSLDSRIRFDEVRFAYPQSNSGLHGVSCIIPANATTVIMGPSGAGKTTLADILLGLLIPQSGKIYIDDILLDSRNLRDWRSCTGYVPQEPYFFNDTLRANLTWVEPAVEEAKIWEALEVSAAGFVRSLPNKLETVIGDKGSHLSGGERQRLAMARALLRNPKVLILDEATNALDVGNEEIIFEALKRLHGKITIIIITHNQSTLRLADQVLEMHEGKLVAKFAKKNQD